MAKKVVLFIVTLALTAGLGIYSFLFDNNNNIVGYSSIDIHNQDISLLIDESKSFLLTTDNEDDLTLTSFTISGIIKGGGRIKAYIDNGPENQIVILDNLKKKPSSSDGLTMITSMGSISENTKSTKPIEKEDSKLITIKPMKNQVFDFFEKGESLFEGSTQDECIDSCNLGLPLSQEITYHLVFLVQNGTSLELTSIEYETAKEIE